MKMVFKFGFEIPRTMQDAERINKENGNTLWMDALAAKINTVKVTIKILGDANAQAPVEYGSINCHVVYNIKLEGFKRRVRWVAGASQMEVSPTLTYASVVSRETVQIALTATALNDLEVKASDIKGAYLTVPCREKITTILGPEWLMNIITYSYNDPSSTRK